MNFHTQFRDHDLTIYGTRDHKVLVSIDTGETMGIAMFDMNTGELICAGVSRNTPELPDPAQAAREAVRSTVETFEHYDSSSAGPDFNVCIYERPVIRKGSQVRSGDIITLALAAGAAAAAINAKEYVSREPHAWKGSADADAFVEIVRARWLRPEEEDRVFLPKAKSLRHNAWDAVGLGIYYLRSIGCRT